MSDICREIWGMEPSFEKLPAPSMSPGKKDIE